MKKHVCLIHGCLLLAALLGVAETAVAQPITFDEFPVGTIISNQYASQGVLFLPGDITLRLPQISPDPPMPTQPVLRPTGEPDFDTYQGDFWMEFPTPMIGVEFLSGYWDNVGSGVIDVYDPAMGLLTSVSNTGTGPELISIGGLGPIGSIYFNSIADGGGADIDSLTLTPIPAPGALLLTGIGAGVLGWLRRRRTLA